MLCAALGAAMVTGVSVSAKDKDELVLYTWDGMVPQEVLDDFEKETGTKVVYSNFDTDETMLEKLSQAKGGDYDVVIADDYIIDSAVKEGLVQKIDKDTVTNFGNINPLFQGQFYDPDDEYTVPYGAGIPLIVYDPDQVDIDIKGYKDLWDESLKDSVAIIGNYRVIAGITQLSMGESMNEEDVDVIAKTGEKLKELAPNIRMIQDDNTQNALLNGEASVAFLYTSQVTQALKDNPDLKVVYPEEGLGFGILGTFIPSEAPNAEAANEFINYILQPEVTAKCINSVGYYNTNKAADDLVDANLVVPDDVTKGEIVQNVSQEAEQEYNKIWTEVKAACDYGRQTSKGVFQVEIYKGTSAFSGIAIGKILYYHRGEYQIRQSMVDNVKKELDRLDHARTAVKTQIQHMYKNGIPLPKEQEQTLKRQLKLLSGGSFQRAVESMITTEKVSAAYAVQTTRDELANVFRKLEDEAVKEQIENIREISELLIGAMGGSHARINLGDEPVILAAEQLSPNELLEMNKSSLLAIVMHQGSIISHVSIMAKSMAVPTLVEVEIQKEWDGHMAIVDGYTGTLYIDPEPELLKEYEIRHTADMEEREELLRLRNQEDITADGKEIKLLANIGNLDDLNTVLYYGATGIGLLRSEFQYLGRENYPRENELFRAYKKVAEEMEGRPVVIRTVDLGADRQAEYMAIPDEVNPMMGNRGIRLCLDRKKMFKAQLRAIYRASAYGNISLMYPMITSEEELDEIEKLIQEVKKGLDEKNIPYKDIRTGIMIETPAAVMISEELGKRVDFLSLGTNDLTQYTLAMDRQNLLLKNKYNDHHPALVKMIRMVTEAGHKSGCNVYICGELAADSNLTEKFIQMGVDGLSVVPACVLPVRKAIRAAFADASNRPEEQ